MLMFPLLTALEERPVLGVGRSRTGKLGPRRGKLKLQEEQRQDGKEVHLRKLHKEGAWDKTNSWMVRKHGHRVLSQPSSL